MKKISKTLVSVVSVLLTIITISCSAANSSSGSKLTDVPVGPLPTPSGTNPFKGKSYTKDSRTLTFNNDTMFTYNNDTLNSENEYSVKTIDQNTGLIFIRSKTDGQGRTYKQIYSSYISPSSTEADIFSYQKMYEISTKFSSFKYTINDSNNTITFEKVCTNETNDIKQFSNSSPNIVINSLAFSFRTTNYTVEIYIPSSNGSFSTNKIIVYDNSTNKRSYRSGNFAGTGNITYNNTDPSLNKYSVTFTSLPTELNDIIHTNQEYTLNPHENFISGTFNLVQE